MERRAKRPRPGQVSDLGDNPEKRRVASQKDDVRRASQISQEPGARAEFYGTGIQHSGSGSFNARDIYIGSTPESEREREFLRDLRVSDPRDDKERIERTKGGLLRESFDWILDHDDFRRWHEHGQSRLLWIKGDPGKGKTMLACGIISELEKRPEDIVLSYFFCQATDVSLNSATCVVRGLLYLLLDQQPTLIKHLQKKYDHTGKQLFEDTNSWDALSKMLITTLQQLSTQNTYLVVDGLDECVMGLSQLLHLIVQVSSSSKAKWLLSSRNRSDIEKILRPTESRTRLSLELRENAELVSQAVNAYIAQCISDLALLQGNKKLQDEVQHELQLKANGTFLWVALVVQELHNAEIFEVIDIIHDIPTGLDELYERMIRQIQEQGRQRPEFCRKLLSTITATYRPLHLEELQVLVDLPPEVSNTPQNIVAIASWSGSFLTIRDDIVYIIHQSAKDFLAKHVFLFPSGLAQEHHAIASRSIHAMSRTLRRNVYGICRPGFPINQIKPPDPDPLAPSRYSFIYWVNHLADSSTGQNQRYQGLHDGGLVQSFLEKHFLHWLEALSLLRSLPEGMLQMSKLAYLARVLPEKSKLTDLFQDGLRFIRANLAIIENSPLQVYTSALIFCPERSIIRESFRCEEPQWLAIKPDMDDQWNACLQTLEGHYRGVSSVAFSGDSTRLASGSRDCTVKVWDFNTGQCLQTLEGHNDHVRSVTFSGDNMRLASGSADKTIKVWDSITGQNLQTLKAHTGSVSSVAFSRDSKHLVSASSDSTIRTWDSVTGQCLRTLKGHTGGIHSIAFSSDSKQLASASADSTIKVWDISTGQCLQTLKGHSGHVVSVAFSGDNTQLASASDEGPIKVWESATGRCLQTINDLHFSVTSVAFSGNCTEIVSTSTHQDIKVWDSVTGQCLYTLKGHSSSNTSVAFSGDSKLLASTSEDGTIKIWDYTLKKCHQTFEGHNDCVWSVTFSGDSTRLASASYDDTIKIWSTVTGQCLQTLKGHSKCVWSATFSGDSTQIASESFGNTVKIWESRTGQCLQTLKGHTDAIESVAFSSDNKHVASGSRDSTIKIWDSATGQCLQTLKDHNGHVTSVAFSSNSTQIASASDDKTVKVWNSATGQCFRTFYVGRELSCVSFSETSQLLYTEMGALDLRTTASPPSTSAFGRPHFYGYGISADNMWITRNSVNLVWLPPEYRPKSCAVEGSMLAIGCATGRVLIFHFSENDLV
ncbi:hypothetical protein EsH8_V_001015 [Colletotrichum jinshuiense]